jgi:hypothetical protein
MYLYYRVHIALDWTAPPPPKITVIILPLPHVLLVPPNFLDTSSHARAAAQYGTKPYSASGVPPGRGMAAYPRSQPPPKSARRCSHKIKQLGTRPTSVNAVSPQPCLQLYLLATSN